MKTMNLPLGVDIGSTRVRVLHAVAGSEGPRLRAVAVRDLSAGSASSGQIGDPEYVATVIEEALAELGTKERRCVCALAEPDGYLRTVELPPMSLAERWRAARLEAQRDAEYPHGDATIRLQRGPRDGAWILGVARSSTVQSRVRALRCAGLRPLAMDHESYALGRALPGFDAVVDVGHRRAALHVTAIAAPATLQTYNGGADVTTGIRRDLAIDEVTAEKRKRILGTAGAGERARAALTADLAALVRNARRLHDVTRIALVGNATRLAGLAADLAAATGAVCEQPVAEVLRGEGYPDDVVRSSSPDWTLAAGLALWRQR